MITNQPLFLFAATAIALSSSTTSVSAEELIATRAPAASTTVSIADLDVASPAGMATLSDRIRRAAESLCLTNNVEPLETRMARRDCFRAALLSGRVQVEVLTAAEDPTKTASATLPKAGR
jgi:UrcA family protein